MLLFNAALASMDRMDGINRYTIELLKRFDKNRFVFAANRRIIEAFQLKHYIEVPETLSAAGTKGTFSRLFWSLFKLPALVKKLSIELVYTPYTEGLFFSKVKQIVTVHDLLTQLYPECYPRLKYYFRFGVPILLRSSSLIIAISESTKKDVVHFYHPKTPVHVIYNGGNFEKQSVKPEVIAQMKGRFHLGEYLFFISENRPYKNLKNAVIAFSKLKNKDIGLAVAGKMGPFAAEFESLTRTLGIRSRVKFLGFVSDEDLKSLYAGAKALLFPSFYEGFGFPPLEAMAFGCPVIASRAASIPEVCGDAAFYISPEEPGDIAVAIDAMLSDKKMQKSFTEKGYERIGHFRWEKVVSEIMAEIERALSQK
jgi:glycosyltransferase involved in cell wall biosynthesis